MGTGTKGDTQEVDTASTDAAAVDETEAKGATPENVDVSALVTELETRRTNIKELEQKNLDLNNQLLWYIKPPARNDPYHRFHFSVPDGAWSC
jgi:hypothetical protein